MSDYSGLIKQLDTATGHPRETATQAEAARAIEAMAASVAELEGRLCVNCGRTFPASHPRDQSPADCNSPEVCTIDMTLVEACAHWRKVAHDLRTERDTANARLQRAVEALRRTKNAIECADPNVLTCTLWMPDGQPETVVDHIAATLTEVEASDDKG